MKAFFANIYESFATILDQIIEGIQTLFVLTLFLALGGGVIFVCLLILRAIADFVLRR